MLWSCTPCTPLHTLAHPCTPCQNGACRPSQYPQTVPQAIPRRCAAAPRQTARLTVLCAADRRIRGINCVQEWARRARGCSPTAACFFEFEPAPAAHAPFYTDPVSTGIPSADRLHSECRITHSQIRYKLRIGGTGSAEIRHSDCRNSQVAIQVTAANSALRVQTIGSQSASINVLV